MNRNTGQLSVSGKLDRERKDKYTFKIQAEDGGGKKATVNVEITILDVNDSTPKFPLTSYSVKLAEDAELGTNVFKIQAQDTDKGDMLTYEITSGNEDGTFILEMRDDGSVNLLLGNLLDYSNKKTYVLKIRVSDQVQHSSSTIVNIHIQDKNSYPPQFQRDIYVMQVIESKKIGSIIGKVTANDLDSGENARLTYTIDDENQKDTKIFAIDENSGSISLLSELDNEQKKYYSFKVNVFDHGIPRKSDSAWVEIRVLDVNDNQPIFENNKIVVNVKEDIPIGSVLTTVKATDADESRQNGVVEYQLTRVQPADRGFFLIDRSTGIIRLNKRLDREKVGCYELEVTAKDNGNPSLSAKASVTITIEDVNDNPPHFKQTTYYIQEDKPVGSIVARIEADDDDIGDNANLEYFIINDGEIENIFYLDSSTGELELRRQLDYETRSNYTMNIQVFSGDLQTTENIIIKIVDVNDNKPVISDLNLIYNNFISVNNKYKYSLLDDLSYTPSLPTEPIGIIPYHDPDILDTLTFGQVQKDEAIIKVNSTTGEISIGRSLDANVELNAKLEVFISDGLNRADGFINIEVKIINEDTLKNAIVVKLLNVKEENFIEKHLHPFRSSLKSILRLKTTNDVIILDLQESKQNLEVTIAARRDGKYVDYSELSGLLYLNYNLVKPSMLPISESETCAQEPCENYNVCHSLLLHDTSMPMVFSQSKHSILRKLNLVRRTSCDCPTGYAPSGHSVNLCLSPVNTCWNNPCENNGKCVPTETGYYCECKSGSRGKNCEYVKETGRCSNPSVPFGPLVGSCGSGAAQCTDLLRGGYQCSCSSSVGDSADTNDVCDGITRSFVADSFAMFRGITNRWDFVIEFKIKTVSQEGMILYNGRLSGESDLLMLKLVGGRLYLEFNTGEMAHSALIKNKVSNGNFETVRLSYRLKPELDTNRKSEYPTYKGKSKTIEVTLQIGNCPIEPNKNDCSTRLEVVASKSKLDSKLALDMTGPLFIGGRPRAGDGVKSDSIVDQSFVGCLKNFHLDGELMDLSEPLAQVNSEMGCRYNAKPCDKKQNNDFCSNHGKCLIFGSEVKCECQENYSGDRCERPTQVNTKRLTRGYLKIDRVSTLTNKRDDFEIELQLRTKSKSGGIVSWDRFEVFLYNGFINLKLQSVTHVTKAFIADTEWHHLSIKKIRSNIFLKVDNSQILLVHKQIETPTSNIVIGDRKSFKFIGCITR